MARYALSDLHGNLKVFLKVIEYLQPDDIVYFLGDAADRGFQGWEIIKSIYNDPRFIYMKGNHEDMLAKAILAYKRNPETSTHAYSLLQQNGGQFTFESWWKDGADTDWADKLNKLPLYYDFVNDNGKHIFLSHAGFTPWADIDDPNELAYMPVPKDLLWDREHLLDDWDEEECIKNAIVVHGHTTIRSLFRRLCIKVDEIPWGAYWYCDNHKVDIDNYTALTNKTCLLNLDTLEHVLIEV
jgi:calcineurin-like phosphoesterase family protein